MFIAQSVCCTAEVKQIKKRYQCLECYEFCKVDWEKIDAIELIFSLKQKIKQQEEEIKNLKNSNSLT